MTYQIDFGLLIILQFFSMKRTAAHDSMLIRYSEHHLTRDLNNNSKL